MANITYYLGAGASYNSFPIQKFLCKKMQDLGQELTSQLSSGSRSVNINSKFDIDYEPSIERIANDIAYFGFKGEKYGTIDTYARKLYLNGPDAKLELDRLKASLSIFLTFWQTTDWPRYKQKEENETHHTNFEKIDKRYLSLMSALIENKDGQNKIPKNINFITWNYDLQLQLAFNEFYIKPKDLIEINNDIVFSYFNEEKAKPQIIHLNGYSGLGFNPNSIEIDIQSKFNFDSSFPLSKSFQLLCEFIMRNAVTFERHIQFAWEDNLINLPTTRINQAKSILKETDFLIIIGYSFPTFNKIIDKELFSVLDPRTKVVYQDPSASTSKLNVLFGRNTENITVHNDRTVGSFELPYEF